MGSKANEQNDAKAATSEAKNATPKGEKHLRRGQTLFPSSNTGGFSTSTDSKSTAVSEEKETTTKEEEHVLFPSKAKDDNTSLNVESQRGLPGSSVGFLCNGVIAVFGY
ncbi:hypothetical protein DVH05_015710 [Phytophthora capsici]|nr:hypothetical protein DVH05_015710 [Phytophthora capsici]